MGDADAAADRDSRSYLRDVRREECIDRVRRVLQAHLCQHTWHLGTLAAVPLSRRCEACVAVATEMTDAIGGLDG